MENSEPKELILHHLFKKRQPEDFGEKGLQICMLQLSHRYYILYPKTVKYTELLKGACASFTMNFSMAYYKKKQLSFCLTEFQFKQG